MTSQRTSAQTLKSIAGSFLVAPGLVLLCGHVDGVVTRCHQLLSSTPDPGFGVFSSVILAASFSPGQLLEGLLHTICPPLLLVFGGVLLLWNTSAHGARALGTTGDQP
jgi:hypothetical protein